MKEIQCHDTSYRPTLANDGHHSGCSSEAGCLEGNPTICFSPALALHPGLCTPTLHLGGAGRQGAAVLFYNQLRVVCLGLALFSLLTAKILSNALGKKGTSQLELPHLVSGPEGLRWIPLVHLPAFRKGCGTSPALFS